MLARRLSPLAVLPLCLLLDAGAARSTEAGVPAPEVARVRGRTALVLFVSYRGHLSVFPDPTRVRHTASSLVSDALTGPELEVVTYPAIEPAMQEWRVRSERDLGSGFLAALATELDLESFIIATLIVTPERVVLLIRHSSLETWDLQKVEILEERTNPAFWADAEGAQMDLEVVVGRAVRGFTRSLRGTVPSQPQEKIVVLPLRPVGTGRGYANLAMHSLLGALLDTGRWRVSDPALTVHALQEAGFDPMALGPASRATLVERFGIEALLIARLTAFPANAQTPAGYDEDLRAGLGPSFIEGVGTPFHFSVTAVDPRTGVVLSAVDTYLAPDTPYGTFGRPLDVPVARRFLEGSEDLVERLLPERGK